MEELVAKFTNAMEAQSSIVIYAALFLTLKALLNTTPPAAVKGGLPDSDREFTQALARSFIAQGKGEQVPEEDKQGLERLGDQFARHVELWKAHKDIMEFVRSR